MDMDITSNDGAKSSPEPDPRRISIHSTTNTKPLSFTNGVLKRHRHRINTPPAADDVYKECLKNHAAALGGHALDGCGEFMPCPSTNPSLPTSLKCAACGCHRNFHRRETEDSPPPLQLLTAPPNTAGHVMEYQSQRRHHPLPSARPTSPYPPSPPPISSSYYPSSAPHILLALSTGLPPPPENSQEAPGVVAAIPVSGSGRKRFRTKFSSLQKEKMYEFAERVGWKMQKRDEERINEFCNGIGIGREVFKVWMHNNKSTFGKRSSSTDNNGIHCHEDVNNNNGPVNPPTQQQQQQQLTLPHHSLLSHNNLNGMNGDDIVHHHHHHSEGSGGHVTTNGSFSSS
ncbi:unnamed protein product [Rhodiola kirilowii]